MFSKSLERPSSPNDGPLASSPLQMVLDPSSPLSNSYPVPSSVAKPSSAKLFPASHFCSEAKEGVSQRHSAVTLPSTVPSFINGSGSAFVSSSNIFKSELSLPIFGSKTERYRLRLILFHQMLKLMLRHRLNCFIERFQVWSQNDMGGTSDNSSATSAMTVPPATLSVSEVAQSSEVINGSMQSAISIFSHEEETEEEVHSVQQPLTRVQPLLPPHL